MTNHAGQREIFANRLSKNNIFELSGGVRLGI